MSRFALLLLASALMLIVAACDSNGDDAADDVTDDTTTIPSDDTTNETENETDDITIEDEPEPTDEADVSESPVSDETETEEDANGTDPLDDDGVTEDDEAMSQDDDVALEDEEMPAPDADEMPDPTQGMFFDLTIDEANEMTEFELREPANVPEALELRTIIGLASAESRMSGEEQEEDEAATIVFSYEQPAEEEMMQGLPVEFTQSTELDMSEGLGPDVDAEEITIGDREVTRIRVMQETGDEVIAYAWNEDDIHFSLAAILGGEIQEEELEEMIASVPMS